MHHGVRGGAGGGEALIQPDQRGHHARILVAQAMHQAHRERIDQRRALKIREHARHRLARRLAAAEQAIRQPVRLLARGAVAHDQVGQPPQVFDQHNAQRDGKRPQLADGQRLHLLIGAHVAAQHFRIEPAVGMRDERPGDAEHAGIAGKRSVGELGQLAVIAGRKVGADLADLPFDEVIVVDQPFRRGGDRLLLLHRVGDAAMRLQQRRGVIAQTPRERVAAPARCGDRLGGRQAARVLFQPLDTEQLLAHRLAALPRRNLAHEGAGVEECQGNLSAVRRALNTRAATARWWRPSRRA